MSVIKAIQRAARPAAIAVALVVASSAAQAQQQQPSPASLLVAKQIVTVTGATALFNPLIAGVVEQAKNLYLQQNPGLAKDLNEIANKMRKDLQPRFSELTKEIARLYATHFTEQELKDILAFYRSPTGKKMLAQQPNVIDASMKFAQDWANKLSEQVTAQMREELKKKGHDF
jgi:uncharacterized protein